MTRQELLAMMRSHRFAVQASVSPRGSPQAAVVGIVVTDDFALFFDTLDTTRKLLNLRHNPNVAFVIGGPGDLEERTIQYEGVADEPSGSELEGLKSIYLKRFPDGRERESWPGLVYVRVRPSWIRCSDFAIEPPAILELDANELAALP